MKSTWNFSETYNLFKMTLLVLKKYIQMDLIQNYRFSEKIYIFIIRVDPT